MAWQTPKTDWKVTYDSNGNYLGDFFEVKDYQRIRGNLLFLKEEGEKIFSAMEIPEIPNVSINSYGYASYINALEKSLEEIIVSSVNPGIPPTKTWKANGAAPSYADLNRIEGATQSLYDTFNMAKTTLVKLPLEMGGSEF